MNQIGTEKAMKGMKVLTLISTERSLTEIKDAPEKERSSTARKEGSEGYTDTDPQE